MDDIFFLLHLNLNPNWNPDLIQGQNDFPDFFSTTLRRNLEGKVGGPSQVPEREIIDDEEHRLRRFSNLAVTEVLERKLKRGKRSLGLGSFFEN